MITGSSAIQNIFTKNVTEPHIRATLKYNSFIGAGYGAVSDQVLQPDTKTILFNSFIVTYDNILATPFASINSYNGGGSVYNTYVLSAGNINGVSWNDGAVLQRGDFKISGSTLELYFIKTGSTNSPKYISKISRISSENGITWSGETVLSTTIQGTSNSIEYDLAVGNSRDFYTMSFDSDHDAIHYGLIGSSQQNIYTDQYSTSSVGNATDKRISLFEFSDAKYLVMESGYKNTERTSIGNVNSSYSPFIKLLRLGSTSVFDVRTIASVGYKEDALKLSYGYLNTGNSYAYFGINRYNRENQMYNGNSGILDDFTTVDITNVLCKMDSLGRIYQRAIALEPVDSLILCIGDANGSADLTLMISAGEQSEYSYPFFENYGTSTDISNDILSYNNSDNHKVTLELGNIK